MSTFTEMVYRAPVHIVACHKNPPAQRFRVDWSLEVGVKNAQGYGSTPGEALVAAHRDAQKEGWIT